MKVVYKRNHFKSILSYGYYDYTEKYLDKNMQIREGEALSYKVGEFNERSPRFSENKYGVLL